MTKIKHVGQLDLSGRRAASYPPLTDLADALVHQAAGNDAPLKAYISDCLAVKARFPKPRKDK